MVHPGWIRNSYDFFVPASMVPMAFGDSFSIRARSYSCILGNILVGIDDGFEVDFAIADIFFQHWGNPGIC